MATLNKPSSLDKKAVKSLFRPGITIVISIFIFELVLTLVMEFLLSVPVMVEALISGVFLVIFLAPVLYYLIFRPMIKNNRELRLNEEEIIKFKLGIENSIEAIFITNPQGEITYSNPAFETIYGYSQVEALGKTPRILKSGILPAETYKSFWTTLIDKKIAAGEIINKTKEGRIITIDGSNNPILDANGKIIGFLGVHRDITSRKQGELENQTLYEITHAVTTTSNLQELLKSIHKSLGKIVYAENCFFALYDQNTGLYNFPFFVDKFDPAPSPVSMIKSCTAYVFRTGKSTLITPRLFKQLIEQKEVELVGSSSPSWIGIPLKTSSRIIGVLVLQNYETENVYNESTLHFLDSIASQVANVIERKKAEEELKKSEEKFRTFFEKSPIGIEIYDATGIQTDVNPASLKIFGIEDKNNSLGFNIFEGISLSEETKKNLQQGEQVEYLASFDFDKVRALNQYQTKRSGNADMQYSITPLKSTIGESILGYLLLVQDITELRQAEKALKENEIRLRELNATKDKFFSIIGHDLKNPFNAIMGFSNLLVSQVNEKDYDGIGEYATIIQDSSKRALNLLTNLLEWSQSQTGRMEFNPEYFEITALIIEVTKLLSDSAIQKSISVLPDLPHKFPVFADKAMVGTVLRNLVSNAIKFTNPGGKISISIEQAVNETIITVTDNGIGMGNDVVTDLFRIDKSISTKGTQNEIGTGLGLILCKEFIKKHGGRIWVESIQYKGSTFNFTLPKF